MTTDFDLIINRHSSDSIKWNYFDDDILPLWVADTDFQSPQVVIDALRDRIDHGVFGYSLTSEDAKRAVQNWLASRHDWKISTEEIVFIPGVVQAFNLAARAFTNPGDSILIQTPAYHPFFDIARNLKLQQDIIPLQVNRRGYYSVSRDGFNASINPRTRLFMLCNPHNPTGRVFSRDELTSMAQACLEHNVIICSDEIHSDLVYAGYKHIPTASLSESIAQNTVTFISASKTFNLAGLKSSAVIISNPRLRQIFQDSMHGIVDSVNLLGQTAITAAYTHGEVWLEELLTYLAGNRDLLVDYVSNELPEIKISSPEATFLGWLDFSNTSLENPAEFFLRRGKVALNAGDWFGEEYGKYARINFGCPQTVLLEGLERIKQALHKTSN